MRFLPFAAPPLPKSKREITTYVARSESEVAEIVKKWAEFVHPRAREFFGDGDEGMLTEVLTKLARNTPRDSNPIPGSKECIHWFGETTEGDRHPVMTMVKPGESHESVTYVSRVLVFLFATDASFEKLMQLPKEPFKMSCDDPLCINLNHITCAVYYTNYS
jgi:hypothetical protein